jgi:hypothetical protein
MVLYRLRENSDDFTVIDSDPIDIETLVMNEASKVILSTLDPLSGKGITTEQVNRLVSIAVNAMQNGLNTAISQMGLQDKKEVTQSSEVIEMIDSTEMKRMQEELAMTTLGIGGTIEGVSEPEPPKTSEPSTSSTAHLGEI